MDLEPYVHKLLKPHDITEDYPPNGEFYTVEELQKAVEGYFQIIGLDMGYLMIVNEEGLMKGLQLNHKATLLFSGMTIVGNALVCRGKDID